MRRLTQILQCLSIAVIAVGIAACSKTPTGPPAGPSITLSLPDTAALDEPVSMAAHISDSMELNWLLEWHFGDSTSTITSGLNATHSYLNGGVFKVEVDLLDTLNGKTLSQAFGGIRIGSGPTLILMIPDSVRVGDTTTMKVSCSSPLHAGWVFSWSFGDNTTLITNDTLVSHYYLHEGSYVVNVVLTDTNVHGILATQTDFIKSFALHFDLALLQTMPFVKIECNKKINHVVTGIDRSPLYPGLPSGFGSTPIVWKGLSFCVDSINDYSYSDSLNFTDLHIRDSALGAIDANKTEITSLVAVNSHHDWYGRKLGGDWVHSDWHSQFSVFGVPLKSQTTSAIVFEAVGKLNNPSFHASAQHAERLSGSSTTTEDFDWSDISVVSRVTITFHK